VAGRWPLKRKSGAGFTELESIRYTLQDSKNKVDLQSARMRLWQSYFPADGGPVGKPLFVFLNGGPGCTTATNLFAMNTAPFTLDREHLKNRDNGFEVNGASWSQLGNLLYIDAPNTGYSYNLVPDVNNAAARLREFGNDRYNSWIDAAQVLRVLLRFLENHPSLKPSEVILVGESYAGTRVSTMLNLLLFHSRYAGQALYQDKELVDEIDSVLRKLLPGTPAGTIKPAQVAKFFARQVFIQPQLSGPYQWEITGQMFDKPDSVIHQIGKKIGHPYSRSLFKDPVMAAYSFLSGHDIDRYNYSKPKAWTDGLEAFAVKTLTSSDGLSAILGADVRTIPYFSRADRSDAYRYVYRTLNRWLEQLGGTSEDTEDSKVFAEFRKAPLDEMDRFLLQDEADSQIAMDEMLRSDPPVGSLEAVLGKMPETDDYLVTTNYPIYLGFTNVLPPWITSFQLSPKDSALYGELFLQNLALVDTFITDAAKDIVIWSPALPEAFKRYDQVVTRVDTHRGDASAREGTITVEYRPGVLKSLGVETPKLRTIFWPHYAESGHSVSSADPYNLLEDVKSWLAQ